MQRALRVPCALALLASLTAASAQGAARPPLLGGTGLRPTLGGALVETVVTPRTRTEEALTAVWASGVRAKLLHCQPRCRVVTSIPVRGVLRLGPNTPYRVVLGGSFTGGRRVGLLFAFRAGVVGTEATVTRLAAFPESP
jgi:hypothetical protein